MNADMEYDFWIIYISTLLKIKFEIQQGRKDTPNYLQNNSERKKLAVSYFSS